MSCYVKNTDFINLAGRTSGLYIVTMLLLSLLFTEGANAQIIFSPTILTLNNEEPVKEIRLTNLSDYPQEVEIIKRFGYPVTLPDGQPRITYGDQDSEYNLSPYVQVYPSRIIIPARSRQIVRIQVRAGTHMKEQVYWTRLGIRSAMVSEEIGDSTMENTRQKISYVIQQNLGVYFANGEVRTGLELDSVRFDIQNDSLQIMADVMQQGNSPYFGLVQVQLRDENQRVVAETERVISVFFESTIAATLVSELIQPQKYTLEIRFETERADIPESDIIKAGSQVYLREIEVRE